MDIEKILGKKGMKTLEHVVPALCRRFGSLPEIGWEILRNHDGELKMLISETKANDTQVRGRVNRWWKEFHKDFGSLGLGQFQKVSRASKAEASYELFVCLCFLTEKLRAKKLLVEMQQEQERIYKVVPRPKAKFRYRIFEWIKRLLERLFGSAGVLIK